MTGIIAGLADSAYAPARDQSPTVLEPGVLMLRLLAAGWLTRRLARPISRLIPNPYLRAAAIAGAGLFAGRLLKVGPSAGGRRPRR